MNLPHLSLFPILLGLGACASAPISIPEPSSYEEPARLEPSAPAPDSTPASDEAQSTQNPNYPPPQGQPPPQQPPPTKVVYAAPQVPQVRYERWRKGAPAMQGYLGVSYIDKVERSGGGSDVTVDSSQFPVFGGGGQFKLGGERIDLGLEGLFDFSGRANVNAFAVTGGGAAVSVDVDMWIFEFYGGPFANIFLGDKCRVYAAAGPVLEWANYNQYNNGFSGSGSGFGSGWYARSGIEFATSPGMMLGLCARWTDTTVDLGGSLGDLDIQGTQILFTVTRGF